MKNYKELTWAELINLGKERGVYGKGMKKDELIEALKTLDGNITEEELISDVEKAEVFVEPEVEKPAVRVGVTVFEAIPDREGKILPLEVSINDRLWVGHRIEVEDTYVADVKRLLKGANFLFTEVR